MKQYTSFWIHGILFIIFLFLAVSCNKERLNRINDEDFSELNLEALLATSEEDLYYWSSNRKYPLSIDSSIVIVEPAVDSVSFASYLQKYGKEQGLGIGITPLRNTGFLRLSAEKGLLYFLQKNRETINIKAIHPSYRFGETLEMVPTGEIVLKLKSGGSIQTILDQYKGQVTLAKTRKRDKFTLRITNLSDVLTISNRIYESGIVEWCHPDFIVPITRASNDNLYPQQYYLNQTNNIDINAPQAWNLLGTSNCPVRVAVIDDGVEAHIDLPATRILSGYTPRIPGGNGAPVNINRLDYVTGHGQSVAGIIGATRDNIEGIAGIADNVQIIPINIFADWYVNAQNYTRFNETPQDIASAIEWAWETGGADILSNSWGYSGTSIANPGFDDITNAITEARTLGRNGKGAIVIFASGNHHPGGDHPIEFNGVSFPANVSGVITVGAIDRNGSIWNYSSRGAEMDLVAPSGLTNTGNGDVVTTDREGILGYNSGNYNTTFGGTSAACPQVAGVAALMLSVNPNLTETQVRTTLQNTATDMGTSGFDNTFGYGRVNAFAALRSLIPNQISGPNNPLCSNQGNTYSINNLPNGANVTWNVSPSGLASVSTNGNLATLTQIGNSRGMITLSATINISCGTFTVTKPIYVGRLDENYLEVIGELNIANAMQPGIFGATISEIDICSLELGTEEMGPNYGIQELEWSVPNANITGENITCPFSTIPGSSIMVAFPNSGLYHISFRVRNICGWSAWTQPKIIIVN